jgi:hypothetical protein
MMERTLKGPRIVLELGLREMPGEGEVSSVGGAIGARAAG